MRNGDFFKALMSNLKTGIPPDAQPLTNARSSQSRHQPLRDGFAGILGIRIAPLQNTITWSVMPTVIRDYFRGRRFFSELRTVVNNCVELK